MQRTEGRMQRAVAWLVVACLEVLSLSPLSAQELRLRDTLKGHTSPVWFVAYSPDGKTLASGSGPTIRLATPDGKTSGSGTGEPTIKLWDVPAKKERATLKGHAGMVASVAVSPDGKTLASGSHDRTVKLW